MKCQKCGVDIPENKIYCENCGTAIQMVPDYNPADDIAIVTEENREKEAEELSRTQEELSVQETQSRWYRYRYRIAGVCLVLFGIAAYRFAYGFMLNPQETVAESDIPELLEKPEFNILPGLYDYAPVLTISHAQRTEGVIYYTTDGTTPDTESMIYNGSIEIGEGTTVIRAVFIRSDGMQSEEVNGTFEVVFDYPEEPGFSVPGGDYSQGFDVILTAEEDCRIYYTTNGEEPNGGSRLYRGPIHIYPGLTVLQAISMDEDGGISGVVEAIYNVEENSVPQSADPVQIPTESVPVS
ncbi:MAG: chitobiase/beta-hexosaminidase C-terminal domain-containing protein [Clostridiales bacterium]|nr:chitobiase/beta-hexosaminidase C-terminal domain-containing protein [Clostridiales bacterium]